MLKNPSSGIVSIGDTCNDLSIDGERLFHAVIMLRTELSGERGESGTPVAISVKCLEES